MRSKVLLFNLPPLGGDLFPVSIGYIAASLARRGIESVICEIPSDTALTDQEICDYILEYKPAVVGIAVYQINIRMADWLAKLVKHCDPGIVVAIGGPQATFMPSEALSHMRGVDVMIRGEGETVLPELVDSIERSRDLAEVKGIVFKSGKRICETAARPLVRDLDDLPSPYQSGVFRWKDHTGAAMLTSRGCTYNCGFCYTPGAFGRTIRAHSVRRVLGDMKVCYRHGLRRFFFADPSFTFDKERVRAIMRGIIKNRWEVEIWCETRSDLVDERLLALMAKAGVTYIAYGLESVDPVVNKVLNKRIDPRKFAETIRMTQAAGIEPEVFTLYGLPKQTRESALQTLRYLQGLGVKIVHNSAGQQLYLFFGTDVFNNPGKYGLRVLDKRRPPFVSPGTDFETEWMTKKDIVFVARKYKEAADSAKDNTASAKL